MGIVIKQIETLVRAYKLYWRCGTVGISKSGGDMQNMSATRHWYSRPVWDAVLFLPTAQQCEGSLLEFRIIGYENVRVVRLQ